jgi:hypothetical protein
MLMVGATEVVVDGATLVVVGAVEVEAVGEADEGSGLFSIAALLVAGGVVVRTALVVVAVAGIAPVAPVLETGVAALPLPVGTADAGVEVLTRMLGAGTYATCSVVVEAAAL